MRLPHCLLALLFWLDLLSVPARAQFDGLPDPSEMGSHRAYAEALEKAGAVSFATLLARYDARETDAPDDVDLALERCRFLEAVAYAHEDTDDLGAGDLLTACDEDLPTRFPGNAAVWVLRVEHAWGEQRSTLIAQALTELAEQPPSEPLARLRLLRAAQLETKGDQAGADREAKAALEIAPQLDASLLLARGARARGDARQAVKWLTYGLERTEPAHDLIAKARLLLELRAYGAADRALREYKKRVPNYSDALLQGSISEGLGNLADARAAFASLPMTEALRRRLELELAHGTAEQASHAYEALRDKGYRSDPLLRRRLRLLWAHPGAPWRLRDLLGALALLGLCLGLVLLPFVVLIPFHYVGLLLRQRGHVYEAASEWTLWRAGRLFGLVLVADTLTTYALAGDSVESWLHLHDGTFDALPSEGLSRLLLASMGASLAVVLAIIGTPELKRAFAWNEPTAGGGNVIARVAKAIGLLLFIAGANAAVAHGLDLVPSDLHAGAVTPVTTQTMLRALLKEHGILPVIMVAVVFAPITEELLFRYVLTDALGGWFAPQWANRAQALLFALCHDQWPMWPTLFCIGLFAGKLRRETSDLSASALLHAAWNLLVSLGIYATFR